MKDCVILGAWIPNKERIDKYVQVLIDYYADCDIYIGINPCVYQDDFITALKFSGLNIQYKIVSERLIIKQHASANLVALELYKLSLKTYNIVHFLHTKGISYGEYHHERAYDDYYVAHAKSRAHITTFLNNSENIGGYGKWAMVQPQVYCKKGYTKDNIPFPPIDVGFSMAKTIEESTEEVHPYFDLSPYFKTVYKPLRTQYLIAIYAIKDKLVRNFVDTCSPDIFSKNIYELGYDMYFFETLFPMIISTQGYLPYTETIWNLGDFGTKDQESIMIDLWKKENLINLNFKILT